VPASPRITSHSHAFLGGLASSIDGSVLGPASCTTWTCPSEWPTQLWLHIPQMNVEIDAAESGGPLGDAFVSALPARSRFVPDVEGLLGDIVFENAVVERTTLLQLAGQAALVGASRTRDLLGRLHALVR